MTAHPAVAEAPRAAGRTDPRGRVAKLFDIHSGALYRMARRLSTDADDAADFVQETFLRAAIDPARVPLGESNEEAWLIRVLVNIQRDEWRRRSVRERSRHLVRPPSQSHSSTEAELIARSEVWTALTTLPPRRRAIVVLHELDSLSVAAIASLLGISVVTVRWHLARGRRELRGALSISGGRKR